MPASTYSVLDRKKTSPSEKIPGSNQVENHNGGFSFPVDDFTRLDRFLVLGTEGGSYYVKSERELTIENAKAVKTCVETDGIRAVDRIVEISTSGRAAKNDPAIFALAIAAAYGDDETRQAAFAALPKVCRIGTHLLHFMQYVKGMRGVGRGLRKALASWYEQKAPRSLALQVTKYGQRDGWSHRDILRLAHPKAIDDTHQELYHYVAKGWESVGDEPHSNQDLQLVWAYERAKRATDEDEVVSLVRTYGLTHEMLPTQWKTSAVVWEALIEEIPITALIRNLATLTRLGLIGGGEANKTGLIVEKLLDPDRLRQGRVHPISVLGAMKTYAQGKGERGTNTWTPSPKIIDALNDAFYLSYGNVEPTNKRIMLALDVSASMTWSTIAGMPGITPRIGSAAMALVTAAVEPEYTVTAFTAGGKGEGINEIPLSPKQRLDDVCKNIDGMMAGGTDCALPMLYALKYRQQYDAFVVYTDSETGGRGILHPIQALNKYRQEMGIPAKLIVVGMVSNNFTIASPDDAGMLDVVGFDTATPNLLSQFIIG